MFVVITTKSVWDFSFSGTFVLFTLKQNKSKRLCHFCRQILIHCCIILRFFGFTNGVELYDFLYLGPAHAFKNIYCSIMSAQGTKFKTSKKTYGEK